MAGKPSPAWSRALLMVEGAMEDAVYNRILKMPYVDDALRDAMARLGEELDRVTAGDPRDRKVGAHWGIFLDNALEVLRTSRTKPREPGPARREPDDPELFARVARRVRRGGEEPPSLSQLAHDAGRRQTQRQHWLGTPLKKF